MSVSWPLPFYPFIKRELKQTSIYLIYLSLFTSSFEIFKPKVQATKKWRETVYSALQYEAGILSLGATLHCIALLNPWKSLSDAVLGSGHHTTSQRGLPMEFLFKSRVVLGIVTSTCQRHTSQFLWVLFWGLWNREVVCGSLPSSQAILWCSSN